jgi:raffinose/stachyose/melibiose transport system substrate-binding protein
MSTMRALAVVICIAALTAACGSGTQGDAGEDKATSRGTVTLTLTAITDAKPAWEELFAKYKTVAPNVTFKASFSPTDQLQTALRAQLGGGNAPDLFVNWPGNGSAMAVQQLAPSGLVADISDQAWIEDVPDAIKPLLGTGGKTYMWSPGVTPIGVIYNKKVFSEVGISEPPRTWSELLDVARQLKGAGKIPFAVGNQTPWITQLIPYAIAPSTAFEENPNLAQDMLDGKTTFADSGWRSVFDRYLELYKDDLFNKSPNGTTFEQTQQLLGSGKAGMVVQVIAALPPFLAAAEDKADLATFPFPASDDPDTLKIPAGVGAGIGASANGKHLAEAKKFIEWLGEPAQMATFSEATFSIPLVGAGDGGIDPMLEPFAPFLSENRTVPFMDQQWPNAKVQPAHFAAVQELVAGKTDVSGLLEQLDEAYKQK